MPAGELQRDYWRREHTSFRLVLGRILKTPKELRKLVSVFAVLLFLWVFDAKLQLEQRV